jgi:hypothetical protein
MILAAHQPNFIPWLNYFDKMNKADIFILLINVQFEKNGWQNRCEVNGKYWTMPVNKGNTPVKHKDYVNGQNLVSTNTDWIFALCRTLGIDTRKVHFDSETDRSGTDRIIELCKQFDCDQYLTNPDAMEKYLDEKKMNDSGIEVIRHEPPFKIHTLEAFDQLGIEGTQKLLKKEKKKWLLEI